MSSNNFRSHAAHPGRSQVASQEQLSRLQPPSQLLHAESTHVNGLLEQMDDVIFAAVLGDRAAGEQAHTLWPQLVEAVGWELLEESREQYLRYAIDVARCGEQQANCNPEHAIAALEIISLLTRN
jgi:hypothetical protein